MGTPRAESGLPLGRFLFSDSQIAFESPFCNGILACEPDALLLLRIFDKAPESTNPRWARNAVMPADHHHPPLVLGLFIKRVELIPQRAFVAVHVLLVQNEMFEVIQVTRIGHDDKWLSIHRNDEGFVAADVIDMV